MIHRTLRINFYRTMTGKLSKETVFALLTLILVLCPRQGETAQCEAIEIKLCRAMPYNMTRMPNLLHHSTQENAILAFEQFEQLINTSCSQDVLLFFLCSMYAPICTIDFQQDPIPPCKGVCEEAKRGCLPIMLKYNVSWPEALECEQLPLYDKGVCISPEAIVTSPPKGKPEKPEVKKECKCPKQPKLRKKLYSQKKFTYVIKASVENSQVSATASRRHVITQVKVKEVLKHSSAIPIKVDNFVELWTNDTCVCPKLADNKDYLIMGHEDQLISKLLFNAGSVAVPYKEKWKKRVKKWDSRGRGGKGRKRDRKNKENRSRGEKDSKGGKSKNKGGKKENRRKNKNGRRRKKGDRERKTTTSANGAR
ncbi:unnamed protein product [Owenia fusiformis]|uniref:Uncharacterized protein n=1 Tax=Owenia fusiformis TaxID=6347 RepID=A0A8J1YC10_OWEFU|nr:unnamed protein product [Owenia fusiformis]